MLRLTNEVQYFASDAEKRPRRQSAYCKQNLISQGVLRTIYLVTPKRPSAGHSAIPTSSSKQPAELGSVCRDTANRQQSRATRCSSCRWYEYILYTIQTPAISQCHETRASLSASRCRQTLVSKIPPTTSKMHPASIKPAQGSGNPARRGRAFS